MKTIINSIERTQWFKAFIAFFACLLFLSFPSCQKDELNQNPMFNMDKAPSSAKSQKIKLTGKLKDVDNNWYKTVKIGDQWWMAENLRTTRYNDKTKIPKVTNNTDWANLTAGAYCWYNNNACTHKYTYGALYNWFTASSGKLCPTGWHVPTFDEWRALCIPYLRPDALGGFELMSTDLWIYVVGTNETGFSAVPGGMRNSDGTFDIIGQSGNYWSSISYGLTNYGFYQPFPYGPYDTPMGNLQLETSGLSVRCLKDN